MGQHFVLRLPESRGSPKLDSTLLFEYPVQHVEIQSRD